MGPFEFDHKGKVALVTGASAGLGKRFAEVLAGQGAAVAMAARRLDKLEELADRFRSEGARVLPVELDLSKPDGFEVAVNKIEAELGSIDILVNNAGVSDIRSFVKTDEDFYNWIMDVNVRGLYFLTQAVVRRMIANKIEGRIVNIASTASLRPNPSLSVYGMSKAAVLNLTKTLAQELSTKGINVNCICPGYIITEMSANFSESRAGKEMIAQLPRGRAGDPSDLDGLILLLTSGRACNFINGAIVSADDGYAAS